MAAPVDERSRILFLVTEPDGRLPAAANRLHLLGVGVDPHDRLALSCALGTIGTRDTDWLNRGVAAQVLHRMRTIESPGPLLTGLGSFFRAVEAAERPIGFVTPCFELDSAAGMAILNATASGRMPFGAQIEDRIALLDAGRDDQKLAPLRMLFEPRLGLTAEQVVGIVGDWIEHGEHAQRVFADPEAELTRAARASLWPIALQASRALVARGTDRA